MKRIIKFRCWNPLMKEMLDDHYLKCHNMTYAFSSFNLEHLNFMQFTGLLDKNGKEIYESDILAYPDDQGEFLNGESDRMLVEWHDGFARFGLSFYSIFGGEGYTGSEEDIHTYVNAPLIIIGNIHENPELINT